ncbi:hypothetical protein K4F52_001079 [Lecanicillium sp. MT-2017a]|nr:hypothetical protein K4F52_001079 [Lecanicillium sp. MT-2017a]
MVSALDGEVYGARRMLEDTGKASLSVDSYNSTAIGDEIRTLPERYPSSHFRVIIETVHDSHQQQFGSSVAACGNFAQDFLEQTERKTFSAVRHAVLPSAPLFPLSNIILPLPRV